MRTAIEQKYLDWFVGHQTCQASKAIWVVMVGLPNEIAGDFFLDIPIDYGEFGSCYGLLEKFPEWKPRLHEVAKRNVNWEPVIREWDRLVEMYRGDDWTAAALLLRRLRQEGLAKHREKERKGRR